MHKIKDKMISVSSYDAPLICHALKKELEIVEKQKEILILSTKRDLTEDEVLLLPSTLMNASKEELYNNINPWESLRLSYEWLMKDFDSSTW